MGLGIGRIFIVPLLLFNLLVYLIILAISGWGLNRYMEQRNLGSSGNGLVYGNQATPYLLTFALIAGVVGIASVLTGLHHLKSWRPESLGAAAATATTALLLTLLAFGLACKEIHSHSGRSRRLKALEAFVIIAVFSQLFYNMMLHAGHVNNRYGPAYGSGGGGYNNAAGTGGYGGGGVGDKPAV